MGENGRPGIPMPDPREKTESARDALCALLRKGPHTAHELSQLAHLHERSIAEHLEHIERSARHRGERLAIEPASCLACGFVFEARRKKRRPSRCPECRSEHLEAPRFRLVPA
jgi:predicted Zn-ribbon and HTH transcriptional regulator